jgi:sugar lactone lactonase YvrE
MYIVGTKSVGTKGIGQYYLQPAWNITSSSNTDNFKALPSTSACRNLALSPEGHRLYVVAPQNSLEPDRKEVLEYEFIEPFGQPTWNVQDLRPRGDISLAAEAVYPSGIAFKPDGTRMYISEYNNSAVHEYAFATAWNAYDGVSHIQTINMSTQGFYGRAIAFKPDGTRMYVAGESSVVEYELSTAWDIATASYVNALEVIVDPDSRSGLRTLHFSPDGARFYVGDKLIVAEYAFGEAI